MPTNVLVLIHGITVRRVADSHAGEYANLIGGLFDKRPVLQATFPPAQRIRVEWGHRPLNVPAEQLRPDQRIMDAENRLYSLVNYAAVKADKSPRNHVLSPLAEPFGALTRLVTDSVKENLGILGLTDAVYYISPDGEDRVRAAVYGQVLRQLDPFQGSGEVRLHVIGQSLGVTLAHDFLFGLFAPDAAFSGGQPGFLSNELAADDDIERFKFWRRAAQGQEANTQATFGSKASTGSQLPLMMMRKQALVEILAAGGTIDPAVIGLPVDGGIRWRIFYDVDDVLGFPTRRIYRDLPTIEEFQVNSGALPDKAHSEYWHNDTVLEKIADLLAKCT